MGDIDKDRQMIRDAAARTAQKIIQPRAAEIDASGTYPSDLLEALGKQGFLNILLPEQYGGMNADLASFCGAIEEIAKVCGSSSLLILIQGIGSIPLGLAGSSSQKERYYGGISEKNSLAAFALAEAEGRLNAAYIKSSARREGTGYLLNGRKHFVPNGGMADFYSVFVVTDPEQGANGISALVIENGNPGLTFGKKEERLGMRGLVMTDVSFENCWVPEENRLGQEGAGWSIATETICRSRPAVGALAVGIAQGALEFAIRYANERIQFGKPIASFQAIQFMIADMATQIEAARSLVYQAAARIDARLPDAEALSTAAKIFASDAAMKVTTDAVQILGGYGYMKDYPVERMMRDAKVTQLFEGSNQAERLLIAQQLIKS